MSRLLKEQAYVDKKGDKLKEVNVDEVNTQLTSDKFRTKQGKLLKYSYMLIMHIANRILLW